MSFKEIATLKSRPSIEKSVTCEGVVLTDTKLTFLDFKLYEVDTSGHDGEKALYFVKGNEVHGVLHMESEGGAYDSSTLSWRATQFKKA